MLPVLLEELELEGIGDLVGSHPGLGLGLESADDEPADLLLEVRVAVGVAQDRQVGAYAGDLLGHDVEVLRRVQRHGDPGQGSDLLGPLSGTVHDDLGLDVTCLGADSGHGPAVDQHVDDPGLLHDPGAPLPGTSCQRLGQVRRVGRRVARQPDRAGQVVGLHDGIALLGLVGREQRALEPVGIGTRRRTPELGHPVSGAGDGDTAAGLVAGGEPDLELELGVQLGGVLHEPRAALRRPQLPDESGRVPRRAGGQAALLEQEHVSPTEPGEVVGDAGADHAAADHDHLGPGRERVSHRGSPPPGVARSPDRRTRRPRGRTSPSPSPRSRSRGR